MRGAEATYEGKVLLEVKQGPAVEIAQEWREISGDKAGSHGLVGLSATGERVLTRPSHMWGAVPDKARAVIDEAAAELAR